MNTPRSAILHMTGRKMGLDIGEATTRYVMLVIVLSTMRGTSMFRLMLVGMSVGLMVLVVLERLGQIHLHISLVSSAIHHRVVAVLPMILLIEHGELLGRVSPRRSGGRGCIGVEEYAGVSSRRSHAVGGSRVESWLRVLWIESLAVCFLIGQVIGHGMELRQMSSRRSPGAAANHQRRSPGGEWRMVVSSRRGGFGKTSFFVLTWASEWNTVICWTGNTCCQRA